MTPPELTPITFIAATAISVAWAGIAIIVYNVWTKPTARRSSRKAHWLKQAIDEVNRDK